MNLTNKQVASEPWRIYQAREAPHAHFITTLPGNIDARVVLILTVSQMIRSGAAFQSLVMVIPPGISNVRIKFGINIRYASH